MNVRVVVGHRQPSLYLYRLGVGRVVFSDWDELWKALMEHWANPDGILKFGDWRPMLNEIDPFRDGRAAEGSIHSIGSSGWINASANTSSTVLTALMVSPRLTLSGISARSRCVAVFCRSAA